MALTDIINQTAVQQAIIDNVSSQTQVDPSVIAQIIELLRSVSGL